LILKRVYQSLPAGGRLVVIDRAPRTTETEHTHEVPLSVVAGELRQTGFEIVSQDDHFIDRPEDDPWWLVGARKP
jgi:hypothetical protein